MIDPITPFNARVALPADYAAARAAALKPRPYVAPVHTMPVVAPVVITLEPAAPVLFVHRRPHWLFGDPASRCSLG